MEIQEKHRLEILNAKCNYVCAASTLVKKMNYGEDVSCCINKLYLASRIIKRLECYCFGKNTTELNVESEYTYSVSSTYHSGTTIQLIANGVQIASLLTTTVISKSDAQSEMLDNYGISYTKVIGKDSTDFTIILPCSVTLLESQETSAEGITTFTTLTNSVAGVCSTVCYNCIEDKNLYEMYALLNQLLL